MSDSTHTSRSKKTSPSKPLSNKKKSIKKNRKSKPKKTKKTSALGSKKSMASFSLMGLLWGSLLTLIFVFWFSYDLPSAERLIDTSRRPNITILARDGQKIAIVGDYYTKPINLKYLPKFVVQAFTATEDRRFFDHFGVDIFGILRAFIRNFLAGRVVQGGSTITQQLAKNFLLTEGLYTYRDRSLRRKIQEVLLAFWLEYIFTKTQIMTIYLNRVYFGSGAFGLGAAAKHYFNKEARDLNLYEGALLAGLLKAPSRYSPHNNASLSQKRTKIVLRAMLDAGYITDPTWEKWQKYKIRDHIITKKHLFARYFVDWILEKLPQIIGTVMEDLVVTTTLDIKLQKRAEKELKGQIKEKGPALNVTQGALLSMTSSGSIRAMVGGYCYGKSQFNRAVQSQRQTGSIFKIFVYLAALEAGLQPTRRIVDEPVKIGKWSPKNYGWKTRGDVSMAEGLAYSINGVSIRLARFVGLKRVIEMAKRMGLKTPQPHDLTIALGTGDASLLEMTAAFATISRGGYPSNPYGIVDIKTGRGKTLYRLPPQSFDLVISKEIARKMDTLLQGVMKRGTGRLIALKNRKSAGKTGTTQNYNDAWFVGYSDDLVTGVWVGNDNNALMNKVTGSRLPGQIWHGFMK